jgi:phosphomannomutase
MFDLTPGLKFKLKDFKTISKIYADKYTSSCKKTTAFAYLTHLKNATPNGVITISHLNKDYIYIKEYTNQYPGNIYIHEWMIQEHIQE